MSLRANSARRRLLALGCGVAVPTLVLGFGWFFASLRERASLAREHAAQTRQTAERVVAAVHEGLEELRRREDARPFYLYNYYYSPPEVLSRGDAVAISPLAGEPDDPRVRGYFQVDPGDQVRSPYAPEDTTELPARAREISEIVTTPAFAPLRALSFGQAPLRDVLVAAADAPLTTNMGNFANQLYNALTVPDAPTAPAPPRTARKQVPWASIQQQQALHAPMQQAQAASPVFEQIAQQAPQAQALQVQENPAPPAIDPTDVDYSPMSYLRLGEHWLLQRVVAHAGTGSVQGVLLDRDYLHTTWLPAVAARHAPAEAAPQFVATPTACADAVALGEPLVDTWLCLASPAPPPDSLPLQAGALLGLVALIGASIVVLARAGRRADELSAQKTAFVSAVSHELRTPLTTLRMHAELLQAGLVGPERVAGFHDDLVRESVRLGRLVENVLAVAQLEEGRRVFEFRPHDLSNLVTEAVAGQTPHLLRHGLAAPEVVVPDEPVVVRCDAQAVEQIVVNLVDNARKYANTGDGTGLAITVTTTSDRAILQVCDRGPGIPQADHDRVFQRFVRLSAGAGTQPGTGIGLALVRELARAHGGDARATNRPGGGAQIEVWWPF